ncbi:MULTISPECIES: flagellar export protein FliJ [Pseudidiomarina]|uniref:Flagellar FliJ protein n=3 Tax=Pseudidiomarina TaxID=2800384 RepID=A0A368UYM1_9GAMM|nr:MULTISPECIES: flagellar export protein FliJ [Pseudidiomarina]PWW13767.1 flagellar FliJ protein [Pseudidiomarina maritima]RBP91161.1 flagellar FliJ protein [Pseudidiomarina tainanensis]RCW33175.1 flagellar FliJ protein [Pseudidiomarina tainanensis]
MNSTALSLLTERAEQARTEAAVLLASERQNKVKISQQLQVLQQYRNEYAAQLQQQLQAGLPTVMVTTYRRFLSSLDQAITQAQQALVQQQQKVAHSTKHWQQQQQQLQSYQTLAQRQQDKAQQQQNKREQKLADELSIAMYVRQQQALK